MPERAAIVTGASSGIGFAVAKLLCEEGWAVTMAARRPDKLEAAAEQLSAKGYDVQHLAGNLADEELIKQVVAAPARGDEEQREAGENGSDPGHGGSL